MFLLLFFLLGSDIGTHVYHEKASGTGILVVQPPSALNSNYLNLASLVFHCLSYVRNSLPLFNEIKLTLTELTTRSNCGQLLSVVLVYLHKNCIGNPCAWGYRVCVSL